MVPDETERRNDGDGKKMVPAWRRLANRRMAWVAKVHACSRSGRCPRILAIFSSEWRRVNRPRGSREALPHTALARLASAICTRGHRMLPFWLGQSMLPIVRESAEAIFIPGDERGPYGATSGSSTGSCSGAVSSPRSARSSFKIDVIWTSQMRCLIVAFFLPSRGLSYSRLLNSP